MKKSLKILSAAFLSALTFLGVSCSDSDDNSTPSDVNANSGIPINIAVFSDDHVYDSATLGSTGSALEDYIANDRKMLLESEHILDEALADIKAHTGIQYLLISGDLTKDGEKVNHQLLASKLQALEDETDIEVFVINGNHDLSNEDAVKFDGDTTTAVETVDRDDFRSIYANFGYNQAYAQDTDSLSYSVNLGNAYRLIVMDSCKYNNDKENPSQETSGELTDSEMTWILNQIEEAKNDNRIPIGMLHHGLVVHTGIQPTMFSEYLLDDYEDVRSKLSAAGMNLVFTGHFHSQDTASVDVNGTTFYDVETGSLVTYPCPERYVTLNGKTISYTTRDIDSVTDVDLGSYSDFSTYAYKFLADGMYDTYMNFMPAILYSYGFATDLTSAATLTKTILAMELTTGFTVENLLTSGFAAHYAGDEEMSSDIETIMSGVAAKAQDSTDSYQSVYQMLYSVVSQLYTDSETADNSAAFTIE